MPQVTLSDLTEIVGAYVDLSSIDVTQDSALGSDIPIDSQEMLRAISRIQSKFKIRLAPQDVLRIRTMGDLLATVRRLVEKE